MVWCGSLAVNQKTKQEMNREDQLPAGPRFALSARVETNRIKATRPPICYHDHHLRRPDIDILDMDDIRKSFSKLKKDFKHRVGGKKRGQDGAGADTTEERAGSPAPSLRSGPRVEEGEISSGISQSYSADPSPHPEPTTADEDRLDDPQGEEVDVDERGLSRGRLSPNPDVESAAGSGPGREVGWASSPLSVIPIAPKQEPDGMWTLSPRQLCLIALVDKVDTPSVPHRAQGDPRPDENLEPSTIPNEKKSSWKTTASATAKLLLRGVRDSADAFGPLKSVAGGLCFILENFEV